MWDVNRYLPAVLVSSVLASWICLRVAEGATAEADAGNCSASQIERGALRFNQCAACHSYRQGDPDSVGPNLSQVVNRKAATVPGFAFSTALRGLDIGWTPQKLKEFLADPQRFAPGTRMAFAGLKQPLDRDALVCYLSSDAFGRRP